MPAGGVERAQQQGARAGRAREHQRALNDAFVQQLADTVSEVQHRRLRQAADHLVGSGQDEVGALRQRVLGQRRVKREVRPPGLVHDQRHAPAVGDIGEGSHVGHHAVVGGGDDDHAHGVGRVGKGDLQRLGGRTVGDAELRIQLRGDPCGAQPGEDQPVDRAGVDVALDDHLCAQSGQRDADRMTALGGAVGEEPGSPCPPRVGSELERLVEGRRRRADVDTRDHQRDVQLERALAERLPKLGVYAQPALVTGHVVATSAAGSVVAQRLEVRRAGMVEFLAGPLGEVSAG